MQLKTLYSLNFFEEIIKKICDLIYKKLLRFEFEGTVFKRKCY